MSDHYTPEELEAMPKGAKVTDHQGVVWTKDYKYPEYPWNDYEGEVQCTSWAFETNHAIKPDCEPLTNTQASSQQAHQKATLGELVALRDSYWRSYRYATDGFEESQRDRVTELVRHIDKVDEIIDQRIGLSGEHF